MGKVERVGERVRLQVNFGPIIITRENKKKNYDEDRRAVCGSSLTRSGSI